MKQSKLMSLFGIVLIVLSIQNAVKEALQRLEGDSGE